MSFLAPLFLIGLAGLAIPVLLHLIQRERKNVVQFPSLMFLQRIPYQSVRRRHIRNWRLLLMRVAALALLVFAFARPFLRGAEVAAGAAGAREVVVLLDRSYSMGYGETWSKAIAAAGSALDGLQGGDRGSLVLFAANVEVPIRSTSDKARLKAAIGGVQPGSGATRYGPALKAAGSLLSESALPRREVVLISDFQRAGWQGAEGLRLPDGTTITPMPVGDTGKPNFAIAPVSLQRTAFEAQQRVTITSGVVNHAGPAAGVDVSLQIGGRAIQTKRVQVAANGSASVTFDPVTVAEPNVRGSVTLPADALERDNIFYFAVSPEEPVRAIVGERQGATRDASLYLTRALAVSDAPRIEARARPADAITAEDLASASVVILNDAPLTLGTAERLRQFVTRGGGLLVATGERAQWPAAVDLLPGVPEAAVDRSRAAARLGALEYAHPLFELFRGPRTGDFAAARFYAYRRVVPATGAQVLARFDDGGPAVLERRVGAGRVVMFSSSLDNTWSDLALKPVFVPFVHRVIRHLAAYEEPRPWRTVGDVVDPARLRTAPGEAPALLALTPSGQQVSFDGEGPDVLELGEQGFYEFRAQARDAAVSNVVASDVDLSESDRTAIEPQELVAAAMGRAGTEGSGPAAVPTDQAHESAQRFWWYLLFAGLVVLAAETVVASRVRV